MSTEYDFDFCFFYDDAETVQNEMDSLYSSLGNYFVTREQTKATKIQDGYAAELYLRMTIPVAHKVIQKILSGNCHKDNVIISTDNSILDELSQYIPQGIKIKTGDKENGALKATSLENKSVMDEATATEDELYLEIISNCKKSQDFWDANKQADPETRILNDKPYREIWSAFHQKFKEQPFILINKDFSQCLFNRAYLKNHSFVKCNFSQSKWLYSFIIDCDCSGSNFSHTQKFISKFENSNFENCDFSNANLTEFNLFNNNNFQGAIFNNASLSMVHGNFYEENIASLSNFKNANMENCKLTIGQIKGSQHIKTEEQLSSILTKIFSPSQLSVMQIDYVEEPSVAEEKSKSQCFIATSVYGSSSIEVQLLRMFKDNVLLKKKYGQAFLNFYYRISPKIAFILNRSSQLRFLIRYLLTEPVVKMLSKRLK